MYNPKAKTRFFEGILYPENMPDNWRDIIAHVLQLPLVYCCHDKDSLSEWYHDGELFRAARKEHVHVIIVFNNTTTANFAVDTFNRMSIVGRKCCSTALPVLSIRPAYEYLIHDTDACIEQGKYLYDNKERVCCNNFDIGLYEQISADEKDEALKEICTLIMVYKFTNFADFFDYVLDMEKDKDTSVYFHVIKSYSGFLDRIIRGNYQREQAALDAQNGLHRAAVNI